MTGTALYRARIALPPSAGFEATLEDVTQAGGALLARLGRRLMS